MLTKRIVELHRQLVTLHFKVVIYAFLIAFSSIFGWHSLTQRLVVDMEKTVTVIKEVVRTIKVLVTEVVRITKKVFKWVGPSQARQLMEQRSKVERLDASADAIQASTDRLWQEAQRAAERARQQQAQLEEAKRRNEDELKKKQEQNRRPPEIPPVGKDQIDRDTMAWTGTTIGGGLGSLCGPFAWICTPAGGFAGYWIGRGMYTGATSPNQDYMRCFETCPIDMYMPK